MRYRPICRNIEYARVYRRGKSYVAPQLVLYVCKNRLGRTRVGFTATKKVGHAVVRNRARRRLREVYRLHNPALKQGWDIVLVGRGRTATMPWKDLNEQFLRLCKKLSLLEGQA